MFGKWPWQMFFCVIILGFCLMATAKLFTAQKKFGQLPTGNRLERIKTSKNYQNGSFTNLAPTPNLAPEVSLWKVYLDFFFKKTPDKYPSTTLESVQTDIKNIDPNQEILIWLGHSSYYFQLDGKRFLVDPVFSKNISPIGSSLNAFEYTYNYSAEDFQAIDYMIITHDHYDHLDYPTINALMSKTKVFICPLGVGSHLQYWGVDPDQILEGDWLESFTLSPDIKITLTPARHFSGRTFTRNQTLWCSYVIQSSTTKLYLGGDSGYDAHFKTIGDHFGPFDLAILECGQYNQNWPFIHCFPDQTWQAAEDLYAAKLLAVHHSKFALAQHPWTEPLEQIKNLAKSYSTKLVHPKVGEVIPLRNQQLK